MLKTALKYGLKFKKKGLFIGGFAVGTAGLKLLSSRDAKKVYSRAVACSFKAKDYVEESLSTIKQHADDVMVDAKELYATEQKVAASSYFTEAEVVAESEKTEQSTE